MSILTCLISAALASSISFKALPLEETGLNVATICQDSIGNMWYGGIDGLTKYDGKRYTHFKYRVSQSESDPDTHIYKILCDDKGLIWAAHISGLSLFDSGSVSFVSFPSPEGSLTDLIQLSQTSYLLIAGNQLWIFDYGRKEFTRDGIPEEMLAITATALYINGPDIYIATDGGDIYLTTNQLTSPQRIAQIGCKVNCILKDGEMLWAGTEGKGLWKIRESAWQVENGTNDIVKSLRLDRNGHLWIGTKNGLKIMEDGSIHSFHYEYYTPGSISHDSICDIFMDWQGTMWLGTYYGGVCYYTPQSSQFESIVAKPGTKELSGNVISDIVEDRDGSLWIGTNSGGLNHMLKGGRFEHIRSGGDNPVDVKCIYISPYTGRIYVGADRSDIYLLDRRTNTLKSLGFSYSCYAMVDNLHGGFYAGGSDGVYEYDEKSGHFSKLYISEDVSHVKSMMLDSRGVLWIGKKYGVSALETKTGKILELPEVLSSIQYVEAFLEDEGGEIWMASNGGVYTYEQSSGEVASYTERDGLPDHVVHGIEQDASGVLWISTDKGLCRMDSSNGGTWTFTTADGLLDNRFTPYAHCKTRSGKMYFGSLHGVISFNPLDITTHSEMVNPVISGMEVNGVWHNINGDKIVLKPNERDLAFMFSCPDYISGDNGKFFYMLDGVDTDWCEAGKDWRAVYLALRPGDYTFRLRYRNSAGVSSESPALIQLKLLAPWYKTYAARMTAIILLILGILALFVWLLSRKDKEYKAQIEQERNDLLRRFSLEFVKLGADRSADKDSPSGTSFTKSDEAFMQQAMDVAKENIGNPDFSIDHFAAKMLMSRSNLNLRVRAKFGVSPLEFLKTVRFNEACRLLLEDKHSVAEISYMVGFASPSYFTAAFRHFMGRTPKEWLRDNKKS